MKRQEELERPVEEIQIPNPFEIWKKVYFATEDAITNSVKEAIGTRTYAAVIDSILDNYLTQHKLMSEYNARNLEQTPFPSKNDVARVAELVISLEDKIDLIETGLLEQTGRVVRSLSVLSDGYSQTRELAPSIQDLTSRVDKLEQSIGRIESMLKDMNGNGKAQKRPAKEKE